VLNWLPFSHIYARLVDHYKPMLAGVLVCLAESAETVLRDLGDVWPTHMASVPRFYEKVLAQVGDDDAALRRIFGPRVNWLSSGGAPLPVGVAQRYHAAGLKVLQGYGLTESSPVISFNTKEAFKLESVGRPIPGVEVKIAPDREVLSRGPHIMKGYWNNPQATAETLRDGWLHTGDLGELDADGFLRITGRKKEILVLSNGKKVVPSYIEGLLVSDPCIDQAVVCGEGRNFLSALIVPHWDNLRTALAEQGQDLPGSAEACATSPVVHQFLEERIRCRLAEVSPAEQVRKFLVMAEPFSVANEELTVSLKLRRNVVLARNVRRIEALYR
jgi:long-chain acyl-CoA synthetase